MTNPPDAVEPHEVILRMKAFDRPLWAWAFILIYSGTLIAFGEPLFMFVPVACLMIVYLERKSHD